MPECPHRTTRSSGICKQCAIEQQYEHAINHEYEHECTQCGRGTSYPDGACHWCRGVDDDAGCERCGSTSATLTRTPVNDIEGAMTLCEGCIEFLGGKGRLPRAMCDGGEREPTVQQDQVEVHWQHPRHDLEQPVLLVWPNPLRENWAAEVLDDGRAKVVAREVLVEVVDEDGDREIEKHTEPVDLCYDTIPQYVEEALLNYGGNYGPVEAVLNEVDAEITKIPDDPTVTLDAYFSEDDDLVTDGGEGVESTDQWQVVEITGIGHGELWFDVVEDGLQERDAQRHAARSEPQFIAIPMNELPDDWGEQWLNGELEEDPYA